MAGRKLPAAAVPTFGPWLVRRGGAGRTNRAAHARGRADWRRPPWRLAVLQPAGHIGRTGWVPYDIATGIQRLADARLIAAAPDFAAALLALLVSPAVTAHGLDVYSRTAVDAA